MTQTIIEQRPETEEITGQTPTTYLIQQDRESEKKYNGRENKLRVQYASFAHRIMGYLLPVPDIDREAIIGEIEALELMLQGVDNETSEMSPEMSVLVESLSSRIELDQYAQIDRYEANEMTFARDTYLLGRWLTVAIPKLKCKN